MNMYVCFRNTPNLSSYCLQIIDVVIDDRPRPSGLVVQFQVFCRNYVALSRCRSYRARADSRHTQDVYTQSHDVHMYIHCYMYMKLIYSVHYKSLGLQTHT